MMNEENNDAYWKANIRLMLILLSIWFLVSFVFGILLVDTLNQIQFFGSVSYTHLTLPTNREV